MSCKLVSCVHRHCVFTIPAELRVYFLEDRTLLDCLFHSVRDVVLRMFSKMNKTENFTPGLICVLHTFGRDLKWNPHIHALISEGGAGNITPWRPVKHFDYNFLRNAFRKVLLERLTSRIGPAFRKVKNEMYTKHADGFYVRAKPNLCTPDITIKYISRYLGRPVIATSRIDTYDGENVTFHYTRHEDNKTVTETIPALNFIQNSLSISPKNISKCFATMGYMQNIISRKRSSVNVFLPKTTFPTFYSGLAAIHSALFRIRPSLLFRVWYFYVGFRSLPQKLHYLNNIERL